jgi:16S rRNA (guanine1207-N2)-methyltransferase
MATDPVAPLPDAADRLILDEASALLAGADVVVIGSAALAVGALAAGARTVRVHLDSLADEAVLTDLRLTPENLGPALLAEAGVVLVRLPKSLDSLDRIARTIAAGAPAGVVVVAGGRLKYMSLGMNEVLGRSFERLDVSLSRQKSRVLTARVPRSVEPPLPRREFQSDLGIWVGGLGGVFAGTGIDIGTRAMLGTWSDLPDYETAIDLGCGSGILAAELKRRRPGARVIASDVSSEAVASARETMAANDLDVEVVRDSGLGGQPDASADLIVLNPPFHDGGAVTTDIALGLFAEAARVLRPGGRLLTVWNSHLAYRPALARIVGPTTQVGRTAKFTVASSTVKALSRSI